MQCTLNSLIGYKMGATDGEIGKVKEFYFDDETWTIRYLILLTGNWLDGREVLISPEALLKTPWTPGVFPVNLTKEQIRLSPDIDTDKPVSRQQEAELHSYYPWQSYWGNAFYNQGVWGIINSTPVLDESMVQEANGSDMISAEDHHLRSSHQVTGYRLHATNGEIGHVTDFIIDDQTWQILDLVIETHGWFAGKKVLIPVRNIKEINWAASKVFVDLTLDTVKNSTGLGEWEHSHPEPAHNLI